MGDQVIGNEATEVEEPQVDAPEIETGADDLAPEVTETGGGELEGEGSEAPAYEPNFSYRILEEEHEMPEWAKAAIRSKEDEERYRDMFERAHGLDHVKKDRSELREQVSTMQSELGQYKDHYARLNQFREAGDWDSYFEMQQIPPQVVLQKAKQILEFGENPEQASVYQQQRQQFWGQQQAQQQAEAMQQQMAETRSREIDMVLQYDQNVSQAARDFDAQNGAGAFRNEMVRRGQMAAHYQQKDISAAEAAYEVLKLIGRAPMNSAHAPNSSQQMTNHHTPGPGQQASSPQYGQPGQANPQQTVVQQPQGQARPPVLPNVEGGSGGAPVRRPAVESIEDLHRIRAERAAR